jgi:predicted amidophosphoribosyltransferase
MRTFVHRMKYHDAPIPTTLLLAMSARLPPGIEALVPIPRSHVRRFRYGCDPAGTLADQISRNTGIPAVRALAHPWLAPRRAGRAANQRTDPRFRAVRPVRGRVALVDDVVTTGRTLVAAADALGASRTRIALTLTSSD